MELSITPAIAAYLPQQSHAQPSGPSPRGRDAGSAQAGLATAGDNRRDPNAPAGTPLSLTEDRAARAQRPDNPAEPARSPGYRFEYQDQRQVMKVHNGKGVLIYQVPSKGQLALIEAEESAAALRREQFRLTA